MDEFDLTLDYCLAYPVGAAQELTVLREQVVDLKARLHAAEVERDAALSTLHSEQGLRDRAERRLG